MVDDSNDISTDELADELETPAAAATTDDTDSEEIAGEDETAAAPTGNKWDARKSLSELLEESDAEKESQGSPAAGPAAARSTKTPAPTGDAEAAGEDDGEETEAAKEPTAKPATTTQAATDGKEAGKARYTVKGADGKAFAFELEPGTKILFQADGKAAEVSSMDELVQLAQKGAAFDRKTTEQGQTIAQLRTRETQLTESVSQVRRVAEETLLAALFDEDKAEQLRQALAPYRDPEFRSGQEAKAALAEQATTREQTEAAQRETTRAEFWQGVGAGIKTEIPKFEHLTDTDAMEVATRFHAGYVHAFEAAAQAALATGVSEAQAAAQAHTTALAYFTDTNLRRIMRGLNAEVAEERAARPTPKGKTAPSDRPTDAASAKAAADAHNKTLTDKLEQRRRVPRLQGGGAAPSGAARPAAPAKARTFSQRMDDAFSLLHADGDE